MSDKYVCLLNFPDMFKSKKNFEYHWIDVYDNPCFFGANFAVNKKLF